MATSGEIVSNIAGTTAFFRSQASLGIAQDMQRSSMEGMCRSLCAQISGLRCLDVRDAASINESISASSFPADLKATMAQAVVQKTMTSNSGTGAATKCTQTVTTGLLNYFTADDWTIFENPACSLGQKVSRACERLRLLNLVNPSEATQKHITAVLASAHWPGGDPTPSATHALLMDIKQQVDQPRSNRVGGQRLAVYPEAPADLPQDMFTSAYSGSDRPVQKDCPRLPLMLGQVVLRSSNKRIRDQLPMASQPQPPSGNLARALLQQLAVQQGMPTEVPLATPPCGQLTRTMPPRGFLSIDKVARRPGSLDRGCRLLSDASHSLSPSMTASAPTGTLALADMPAQSAPPAPYPQPLASAIAAAEDEAEHAHALVAGPLEEEGGS